jgi:hypothetical protein
MPSFARPGGFIFECWHGFAGRVTAFWIWIGLAGGLAGIEYCQTGEQAQWHPPSIPESRRTQWKKAAPE